MTLENRTPFPALLYTVADAQKIEKYVVVMKVSYKIVRLSKNQWELVLIKDGSVPLCLADEYWGEVGKSSVKIESDLAPHKPKCDVILNGTAYSKNNQPMSAIAVRMRLSTPKSIEALTMPASPQPLNPNMPLTETQTKKWQAEQKSYQEDLARQKKIEYQIQFEKTLSVLGESFFEQNLFILGWKKTKLIPFIECPIRWEYAYGGSHYLKKNESDELAVLNEACYVNPLGCGWVDTTYFECCDKVNKYRSKNEKLTHFKKILAPRIEHYLQRQTKPDFVNQAKKGQLNTVKEMQGVTSQYSYSPAGFGFVGRSWLPRISYAGTYDQQWLDEQHPYPPFDMDYKYWNGAPEDQQIDAFNHLSKLELWNLTHPQYSDNGYVCLNFKGHQSSVIIVDENGDSHQIPLNTETVLIDTDQMLISLTHKAGINIDPDFISKIKINFIEPFDN